MSNNACYIVNDSGTTPPASDRHTSQALGEHNQKLDQQIRPHVNQGTYLQYHPEPSVNEHAASHLDGAHSQIDNAIVHNNTSTTRDAAHNHDDAVSGDHVNDTAPQTTMQTLQERAHALAGAANGLKASPVINGTHNHIDTISSDQAHGGGASTMMQTLQDKTYALIGGSSDQSVPRNDGPHDHIETLPGVDVHDNASPTMLATLQDKAFALVEGPAEILRKDLNTTSHELAHQVPEVRGAVQTEQLSDSNGEVVTDIGWHKANLEIPDPLIGGYTNGELFSLIRRFNKNVFDVKAVPTEIASGLDLNDAWSQDHATDKLTLHLQRIYLTVVVGFASLGKQTSRLRSWKETRRTSAFCAVYFTAWLFDLLMPLVLGTLILVVSSVKARNTLFPPAPRALVKISTGGIQKPQAGQLGTNDTLTGAPEKQPGEAIEEEAANFVNNIRHNFQKAVGMHNKPQHGGDPLEGKVPKPIRKAVKAVQAAGSAPGHITETTDQTQEPMEEMIWAAGVNPESISKALDIAPHIVGEIADNWERFANALAPTPPFSPLAFLRIDAVLFPIFLGSLFVNYYIVYKATGLAIGFIVFGDPILTPVMSWLKRNVPNYMELLEPKNNILRGVPTNNQITITLLRIGEAHNTPLPPVPTSKHDDPDHQNFIDAEDIPLDATRPEVMNVTKPLAVEKAPDDDNDEKPKHKHLSKVARLFKGNAKAVVETKLATDHIRAAIGSETAKSHLGVLPKTESIIYAGPSEFKCRFEGKQGWVIITESASPSFWFTRDDPRRPRSLKKLEPVFEIAVKDIKRVKRATAFVNTAVESVAKSSSDKELLASLEVDDEKGKTWRLTAMPERDELFNRLVAIGGHSWENM